MTLSIRHPTTPMMDLDWLQQELTGFIRHQLGEHAQVRDLRAADGHAGLTFLFDVEQDSDRQGYVLRLPPPGVKRRGNTDVYRQAPLLRALHAEGLPVPAVPWAQADEGWFDLPFLIMERLSGHNLLVWDPDPVFPRTVAAMRPLYREAAATLARLHAFDCQRHLPDWDTPRSLATEIAFWEPIYQKAPEPAWAQAAAQVRHLLADRIPDSSPIGLVHGDYQPGNILFNQGRVTGVIDWELAHIGAQALDLGWMLMIADPAMWHPEFGAVCPPPAGDIREAYETARGEPVPDAFWFEALAAYRFASIACLNVRLHRKGQRVDPLWEQMALCVPRMFERARELLETEA
ncbi:phosphotransferase family protein [Salinisphaera sp. P385]|uniref:Phosphotransferase family protein n=1 Tax=Spectribacter acetivorans TaxID=3075603 RepID=A0ABU3BB63_9GAMM|nr:phosphotransferase family protein [Salinisphaera sp. P385]MDT0619499.1 phosphotransferase family protein [Salinisphaera sp. P385]